MTIRGFNTETAKKILEAFAASNGNPEAFFHALDFMELAEGGFRTTAHGHVSPMEQMQRLIRHASLGQMQPIKIGSITLGEVTDVTDPCYNRGRGNDIHVDTVPGVYDVYLLHSDETFPPDSTDREDVDFRINRIRIVNRSCGETFGPELTQNNLIDVAPVDAGLCGFYNQKPNFDDKGWDRFCADLGNWSEWKFSNYDGHEGVCCTSGFGDGCYGVYGLKETGSDRYCILEIHFIEEDK